MSNTPTTVNLEMPVDSFNDELLPVNPMAKRPAALDGKTIYTVIDGSPSGDDRRSASMIVVPAVHRSENCGDAAKLNDIRLPKIVTINE